MSSTVPRCPKCQKTMERGHVPDIGHSQTTPAGWLPGPPQRQRFFGGIKPRVKEQIPLSAFRCPSCSYVELYARADEAGD